GWRATSAWNEATTRCLRALPSWPCCPRCARRARTPWSSRTASPAGPRWSSSLATPRCTSRNCSRVAGPPRQMYSMPMYVGRERTGGSARRRRSARVVVSARQLVAQPIHALDEDRLQDRQGLGVLRGHLGRDHHEPLQNASPRRNENLPAGVADLDQRGAS